MDKEYIYVVNEKVVGKEQFSKAWESIDFHDHNPIPIPTRPGLWVLGEHRLQIVRSKDEIYRGR